MRLEEREDALSIKRDDGGTLLSHSNARANNLTAAQSKLAQRPMTLRVNDAYPV
jgi:hypothetical protein